MTVPTINELYTSIQTDLRNKFQITNIIGKVVLNAFALVQAAKLKIFYLHLARTYQNIFFDTCDDETLVRYGRIILKRDPFPASAGEYKIEVSGTIGATIAPGTTFKSRDTSKSPGQLFVNDTLFTFTSPTGFLNIRALEPGQVSALEIGDEVKSTQPLADVDSIATVSSIISEPIEAEDIEQYRQKVIAASQIEPQGGARVDFRLWSLDAQGVRTSYPYVRDGVPSQIDLYVEANPQDSNPINTGIPTTTILNNVQQAIELDPDTTKPIEDRGRRPMWAVVNYFPIQPLDVDVTITNLSDTSLLPSIKEALRDFLFNIRPYLPGADPETENQKGKMYVSDIINIIRDIAGTATFDNVEVEVDGVIITSYYEFTGKYIPFINDVVNA